MRPKLIINTVLVTVGVLLLTPLAEAGQFAGRGGFGGNFGDKDGRPERITLEQRLEDAGQPLSATQLADISELERGPGYREALQEILTDVQKEALREARKELGEKMKGRRGRGQGDHARMMGAILKKAGVPLSEAQVVELKAIEKGPEAHEAVLAILDDNQKAALEEARSKMGEGHNGRRGKRGGGRMLGVVLKKAGYPLTENQLAEIKALEKGPETREAIFNILDDNQKTALEEAKAAAEEKGYRGKGGRRGGGRFFGVLEEAGIPLTDDQKAQMKELPRGPERREAMRAILTSEQVVALDAARGDGGDTLDGAVEKATAVENQPEAFNLLKQNYPNPFNPTTTIDFKLAQSGNARVEVYSPGGQLVTTLVNEYKSAGTHSVVWDASNHAAGIYICKIVSGDFSATQKMTLIK